jgi:hypothetical protein
VASNSLSELCFFCIYIFFTTKEQKTTKERMVILKSGGFLCGSAPPAGALNRRDFAPWRAIFFVNFVPFMVIFFLPQRNKRQQKKEVQSF